MKYSNIDIIGKKKYVNDIILATKKFIGIQLPYELPIFFDITKRRKFNFNDFSLIDFEYDIVNQTLVIDVVLQVENLFLVDTYSNKLIVTETDNIENYNNQVQIVTYTISDTSNINILGIL